MEQLDSHWTDFHEISKFFEDLSRKFKSHQNMTPKTGTLLEDRYTVTTSRSVLHRTRNVSHKSCTENQNTHFVFCNFFSLSKIVPFMR